MEIRFWIQTLVLDPQLEIGSAGVLSVGEYSFKCVADLAIGQKLWAFLEFAGLKLPILDPHLQREQKSET